MKASEHTEKKTAVGIFLGSPNGKAVLERFYNDPEVNILVDGSLRVTSIGEGLEHSLVVPRQLVVDAERAADIGAQMSLDTHLPYVFPIDTRIASGRGLGKVYKVTTDYLSVTYDDKSSEAFSRSEVLEGALAKCEK